jgi:hypothetical protein
MPDEVTLSRLTRALGVARELQVSARAVRDAARKSEGVGRALVNQIAVVRTTLAESDSDALQEFDDILGSRLQTNDHGETFIFWTEVEPVASALVGWLGGYEADATRAERMRLEAEAYAKERIKAERIGQALG